MTNLTAIDHAQLISHDQVARLAEQQGDPCISIYMPTHRAGQSTRQDPIRFKNLVDRAHDQLVERGMRDTNARRHLEPIARLQDDNEFWRHQADGLAVFLSPDRLDIYSVPLRFEEHAVVDRRFHLKPVFPLLTGDGRFFVLAISQKHTRLLECSRDTAARVDVPDMPKGRDELMQFVDFEKSLQFHSGTQQVRTDSGERAAVFHGHGGVEDDVKARIAEYFRAVDHALRAVLHDQHAPLVYAGVESLFAMYRDASSYANLVDTPVAGNPETIDDAELHARAWSIVSPQFNRDRDHAAERLQQAAGTGRTAADLASVLTAARDGRIETLFVASDQNRWGRYDEATRAVDVHDTCQPGDDDLLDVAAIKTFTQRGTVYAMPTDQLPPPASPDTPLAALLRY